MYPFSDFGVRYVKEICTKIGPSGLYSVVFSDNRPDDDKALTAKGNEKTTEPRPFGPQ